MSKETFEAITKILDFCADRYYTPASARDVLQYIEKEYPEVAYAEIYRVASELGLSVEICNSIHVAQVRVKKGNAERVFAQFELGNDKRNTSLVYDEDNHEHIEADEAIRRAREFINGNM